MITAFVLIEAEPQAIAELGQSLADIDGVREAHSVAGSDTDLVAIVAVADHEAVATTVTERIAKLAGHHRHDHDDRVPFVLVRAARRQLRRLRLSRAAESDELGQRRPGAGRPRRRSV